MTGYWNRLHKRLYFGGFGLSAWLYMARVLLSAGALKAALKSTVKSPGSRVVMSTVIQYSGESNPVS